MPKQPYLSVIIPSYNEKTNLGRGVLSKVISYLQSRTYQWELLLSDDGSTDGTVAELVAFAKQDKRIQVLKNSHSGKAGTVRAAMKIAKGQWRLFTDFDQSTPLSEIEKLLPYTEQGYEVIIGSREMIGALRDKEPWYRHLMGRVFNVLVQVLAVPGVLDTQCGFKLFSDQAADKLFSHLVVYGPQSKWRDAFTGAFDVELLFLANRYGYRIREVPIRWVHAASDRVSPIKDSIRMFRDIIRIRLVALKGAYAHHAK